MQMTGKVECMPWDMFVQVSSTKGKKGWIYLLENSTSLIGPDFSAL